MNSTYIADPRINIKGQAWAILAALAERTPDFADYENHEYQIQTTTEAWYNGRERGFCLTMNKGFSGPRIHITFGECRGSDNIFVDWWVTANGYMNAPTILDIPTAAYENRVTFKDLRLDKAVEAIINLLKGFYLDPQAFLKRHKRDINEPNEHSEGKPGPRRSARK